MTTTKHTALRPIPIDVGGEQDGARFYSLLRAPSDLIHDRSGSIEIAMHCRRLDEVVRMTEGQ